MQGDDGQVYQGEARTLVSVALDFIVFESSLRSGFRSSMSRADHVRCTGTKISPSKTIGLRIAECAIPPSSYSYFMAEGSGIL